MEQVVIEAIEPSLVRLDVAPPTSQRELFTAMVDQLVDTGRVSDARAFLDALYERESLGSTYMGNLIALPHGKSAVVTQPTIVFWRLAEPMTYESQDESGPVTRVAMLAVPEGAESEHLRVLATLARFLMNDDSIAALDAATSPGDVVAAIASYAG